MFRLGLKSLVKDGSNMSLSELVCRILEQLPSTPSEDLESDTVEFKEFSSENALHNSRDLCPVGCLESIFVTRVCGCAA